MCDCNMTSYWSGSACVSRLAANVSCSFAYQCKAGLTCIVNETDIGIFSDVCRCPLGYYYVTGSGCVPSKNYTDSCVGSYQCYELAPLSCRYNDTGLTCLDSSYSPLPACDCEDNYFYNTTAGNCTPRVDRFSGCSPGADCQCISPYVCSGSNQCDCQFYYSSINQTCVTFLSYGDNCSNATDCQATPNAYMTCVNSTCSCNSSGYWNGSQCSFSMNFRATCQSNANCFSNLTCQTIGCITGSNKRCSCPSNYYFSPSSSSCMLCNGNAGGVVGYTKYVINYPTSDLCVAIHIPSSPPSISFTTASTDCTSLTPIGATPQLISVHNYTELDCIADLLQSVARSVQCSNKLYYLGLNSSTTLMFDGTPYYTAFQNPSPPGIPPNECLACCLSFGPVGTLKKKACDGSGGTLGAICDYKIT